MKNLFLLSTIILAFISCNKTSCDSTQTKVGFYVETQNQTSTEGLSYKLFYDDVYVGNIPAYAQEPTDSTKLFFMTIDSKKHCIDVKDINDNLVSANYLQITKHKTAGGTYTRGKTVEGINGSNCHTNMGKGYTTYAALK